jgi:outer membrane protein TolC
MLKKLALLSALFIFLSSASAEVYEKVLTEETSISTALNINHEILLNDTSLQSAKARLSESRSLVFPKIDFNLNLSKFENDSPLIIMPSSETAVFLPGVVKDYYFSTRLALWQTLYAGGRISTTKRLAEMNIAQTKTQNEQVKNNLVNNVKTAFYQAVLLKEKIKIYKTALSRLENKKGSSDDIDYARRKIALFTHEYDKALLDLLSVTGIEFNTIITVEGALVPVIKKLDLDQCILWAYQFRSELQNTQFQESIDGLQVQLSSRERFPTLALGLGQEWLGDNIIGDESSWFVSINANIPIFDGGGSFARLKQRKIKERESTIMRSRLEERIKLQVRKAFADYEFYKMSFNPKTHNSQDVLKAADAEATMLDDIYTLNKSYFDLVLAIGRDVTESE